jgi:nucleolin
MPTTLQEMHRVIVDGLPSACDDDQLKEVFSTFGDVALAAVAYDQSSTSRGFGIVGFADADAAGKAASKSGIWKIQGSAITILAASEGSESGSSYHSGGAGRGMRGARSPAPARGGRPSEGGPSEPSNTVFIRNLAFSLDENALKDAFSDCGTINAVRIPLGEDGRIRGYGYVEFDSVEAAQSAVERYQGKPLNGREVFLDFASNSRNANGGSGGGSFGGSRSPGGRGGSRGGSFGGRGGSRGSPRGGSFGGRPSTPNFSGRRTTFE